MQNSISKILTISPHIRLIRIWSIIHGAIFETPLSSVKAISAIPEVQKIWLDKSFSLSLFPSYSQESSYLSQIFIPQTNTVFSTKENSKETDYYNGTNVIVALLDTGIDFSHPDLQNAILPFGGVSMVDIEPTPLDFHGHGTFCAGLIAGAGLENSNFTGVAPGVKLLNIKVLTQLGIGYWSWIISGIEYAIIHGADIIAMCFSMPGYPNDPVNLAINFAIKRGMIVITAAGDDGPAYSSIGAPGMSQGAITVGAYDDFNHQVATFSGRGSTLSFCTKPDILASGVNITSCRPVYNLTAFLPPTFQLNLTEMTSLFQANTTYGIPLSPYYTVINSTSAAAANVTGIVANLLQHAKFLTNEEIKIILQKTAIPLPNIGPNVQGAGLINVTNAHHYLIQYNLNNSMVESRLYTPNLFSSWSVLSQNATRNSTLFLTNYGTLSFLVDSYQNHSSFHYLQGQFAIKYNDQIKWFSEMYSLRELHNLTADYSTIQTIFTDNSLIYIFTAEGVSITSGFRVNLTIINYKSPPLHNISLFSIWDTDLYWDVSNQNKGDIGNYSTKEDLLYIHDSKNGNVTYIGFTGDRPSKGHEINSSSSINSQLQNGFFTNHSSYSDNDTAVAMEWYLSSELNSSQFHQFSLYIGIGDSFNTLNNSIQTLKNLQTNKTILNLALLSSNLSRVGFVGSPFTSNALLLNIGNIPTNKTFIAFLINSSEGATQTFFSKYIDLGTISPYGYRLVNVTWNPTDSDIYSAYWIVGTEELINEIILYLMNISIEVSHEQNFLDNFFARNIFIKNRIYDFHEIFPDHLPIAPQLIYYPNDIAIFNLTITTNHPLNDLTIQTAISNIPSGWLSSHIPSSIDYFGNLQVIISIPQNPVIGSFYHKLVVSDSTYQIGVVWINFSVRYPSGRILFYKPSNFTNIQSSFQVQNLYSLWNERLDSIYGGYFEFFNMCLQNNYDIDDFNLIKQFNANLSLNSIISLPFELPFSTPTLQPNFTLLSLYDLIIICDPEINLTQNEINTLINYGKEGGNLFFWLESATESTLGSLNTILQSFGIHINASYDLSIQQSILNPISSEITYNVAQITLHNFITFKNTTKTIIFTQYESQPTFLMENSTGKILCIGDSTLFDDFSIDLFDHRQLLFNSINWLLKEKINITLHINHNNSEPLRVGDHLSISIHLTSINGTALISNLTLYTFLIMPSNRTLYMIFFPVEDGWYNSLYLNSWLNETGSYFLVVSANSPFYTSSYYTLSLTFEGATPPPENPAINRNWATFNQILYGILIALIITNVLLGIFLYQRNRWRRKMMIAELKEKMKREITNLLSEYHLYVKELETLLEKEKLLASDKLRMILDKQDRKKELLKKLKKIGKKV
ncbi:MAG: S8 family serine peptidase [Candidatus Helarchaeota archaeon]